MNIDINFSHIPVMLDECLNGLNIKPDGIYVDCTLGGGGHSLAILEKLTTGKLIAIDKDTDALEFSKNKLKEHAHKVVFVHSDFKNLKTILQDLNISKVDGILADLGISSYQIDTAERGFSYIHDGALDMRMNKEQKLSAYDVVNSYSEQELANIIFKYGQDKFSRRIAKGIVEYRKTKKIETTLELASVVEQHVPKRFLAYGSLSKKTFQAIRIEVNQELQDLDIAVQDMVDSLKPSGRVVVITFHSLEDGIVKHALRNFVVANDYNPELPNYNPNFVPTIKLITRKPLVATKQELEVNKRSHSAKVRVAEKI